MRRMRASSIARDAAIAVEIKIDLHGMGREGCNGERLGGGDLEQSPRVALFSRSEDVAQYASQA